MRRGIIRIFGLGFLLAAVWLAISGITIFAEQLDARDWRIAMAEVVEVEQRQESRGSSRGAGHAHTITVYDVQYAYYPNGVQYIGERIGSQIPYAVGDRFDIKYDPDAPENATHILEPSPGALVVNLGSACVFALIGLFATGILKRRSPSPADPPGSY